MDRSFEITINNHCGAMVDPWVNPKTKKWNTAIASDECFFEKLEFKMSDARQMFISKKVKRQQINVYHNKNIINDDDLDAFCKIW